MFSTLNIPCRWEVGFTPEPREAPKVWISATVPGAVQLDWASAHNWGPFFSGENWKDYLWMEDVYWIYRTELQLPLVGPGEQIAFCSEGIDYQFSIFVNGTEFLSQEGMFTSAFVDLTEQTGMNVSIEVRIFPAPKRQGMLNDRTQASHCCKPAVSYGWDFHPRLVPLGIWQATGIFVFPANRIENATTEYTLADNFKTAFIGVKANAILGKDNVLQWELIDPTGRIVCKVESLLPDTEERVFLTNPELWWPHDQGTPAMYISRFVLYSECGKRLSIHERRVGFRAARLIMSPGAWEKPDRFPKTRSHPPITLEINGRSIFAKGSNFVSPDVFPGRIDETTYKDILIKVRDSNMNMLRLWGGAIVPKDSFYELCDEMGILVWQEFPLACNDYPDDPHYLNILEQEARSIIRRIKHHPSVVFWCGGNELYNAWSGMTEQSLPLRLLNKICYEEDPSRPFLSTSPLDGMAHGGYFFRDWRSGEEAWHLFQKSQYTAYTEFGCSGPASVDILKEIIPESELFPPRPGTAWESHHGLNAFYTHGWLYLPVLEHYFGEAATLNELVANGQLLQAEGYRGLFEEVRRQKPFASMALSWCLNEPWPTAANNSLISWPCRQKPALAAVSEACRPILTSARIPKFLWSFSEHFNAEIWLLNDSPNAVSQGKIDVALQYSGKWVHLLTCAFPELPAGTNWRGPVVQVLVPQNAEETFSLRLDCPGYPERASSYILLIRGQDDKLRKKRTLNF